MRSASTCLPSLLGFRQNSYLSNGYAEAAIIERTRQLHEDELQIRPGRIHGSCLPHWLQQFADSYSQWLRQPDQRVEARQAETALDLRDGVYGSLDELGHLLLGESLVSPQSSNS